MVALSPTSTTVVGLLQELHYRKGLQGTPRFCGLNWSYAEGPGTSSARVRDLFSAFRGERAGPLQRG